MRFALSDDFRLKHAKDFLQVKEWQNQLLILQRLFQVIKFLDFGVDTAYSSHQVFILARSGCMPPCKKDNPANFGQGGVSSQPFAVFSLWRKGLTLLKETRWMPRHPLCLSQLHGLGKLG